MSTDIFTSPEAEPLCGYYRHKHGNEATVKPGRDEAGTKCFRIDFYGVNVDRTLELISQSKFYNLRALRTKLTLMKKKGWKRELPLDGSIFRAAPGDLAAWAAED